LLGQFTVLSILVAPLSLLCYIFSVYPTLGHISVLEEARGKRRKIGITDFWTQILFRPLHDSIYSKLSNIYQDGTNNQVRPIKLMLEELSIQNFGKFKRVQSLDLTAATDRLPVDVQSQILDLLGYPGSLWKEILDRSWSVQSGAVIKYSVGQPMGAYSSFAMLALTNHVLVHMAMNTTHTYTPYGVLGDDVAIGDRKVSNYYRELLTHLGVEVNPIKGFDGGILEFAKQL